MQWWWLSVGSFVRLWVVLFLLWSILSKMFHQYFSSVLPVFHQCLTSVLPVFHQFLTIISSVFHQYFTSVSSVFHKKCFTYVLPVSYCVTSVSPLFHQCCTTVSPVFHNNFTSISIVSHQCFTCVVLKSSHLPKHMEGSFVFIYAFVCVCLACHKWAPSTSQGKITMAIDSTPLQNAYVIIEQW